MLTLSRCASGSIGLVALLASLAGCSRPDSSPSLKYGHQDLIDRQLVPVGRVRGHNYEAWTALRAAGASREEADRALFARLGTDRPILLDSGEVWLPPDWIAPVGCEPIADLRQFERCLLDPMLLDPGGSTEHSRWLARYMAALDGEPVGSNYTTDTEEAAVCACADDAVYCYSECPCDDPDTCGDETCIVTLEDDAEPVYEEEDGEDLVGVETCMGGCCEGCVYETCSSCVDGGDGPALPPGDETPPAPPADEPPPDGETTEEDATASEAPQSDDDGAFYSRLCPCKYTYKVKDTRTEAGDMIKIYKFEKSVDGKIDVKYSTEASIGGGWVNKGEVYTGVAKEYQYCAADQHYTGKEGGAVRAAAAVCNVWVTLWNVASSGSPACGDCTELKENAYQWQRQVKWAMIIAEDGKSYSKVDFPVPACPAAGTVVYTSDEF